MAAHEVNVNPIKKWLVHACLRDSQGVNAHESKELPSNAPDSLKEAPNKGNTCLEEKILWKFILSLVLIFQELFEIQEFFDL